MPESGDDDDGNDAEDDRGNSSLLQMAASTPLHDASIQLTKRGNDSV